MKTDDELLRRYAQGHDEDAFRALVESHCGLVYATALRLLGGDIHLAKDVSQIVFTDLARKARKGFLRLPATREVLSGWLYSSTCYAAAKMVRGEQRRRIHENEAQQMNEILNGQPTAAEAAWNEVRPVLDAAMGRLSRVDRDALVLRFFRGLELRDILARKGVKTSSTALAVAVTSNAIGKVPPDMVMSIATAAFSGAVGTTAGSGFSLILFNLMGMTKSKLVVLGGALAVGLVTPLVWQPHSDSSSFLVTQVVTNFIYETNFVTRVEPSAPSRPPFQWSQLESADYRQYIANLKAIGCPWELLKDLIVADVNALYAPRMAELSRRRRPQAFWETRVQIDRRRLALEEQMGQVAKEKRHLLCELLGIDALEAMSAIWGVNDKLQAKLQCIPAEKRGAVAEINSVYSDREHLLNQRAGSFHDQEVLAEQQRLNAEQRTELANVLTPEELLEYDLRFSDTARHLLLNSPSFDSSEEEFRKVFAATRTLEEAFGRDGEVYDLKDPQARQRRDALVRELDQQLRAELGESRWADWQRSQDSVFQQMSRFSPQYQIAEADTVRLYGLWLEARDQAKAIGADLNLSAAERDSALSQVRASFGNSARQMLGSEIGDKCAEQIRWRIDRAVAGRE
ncbi:MAG: sigma-70 family RNA polymerase sigma factor [Verrucomicrobia bacterium]|nr:sigma-70 family RNA polymerase sigma factor [Verrucomicrobiota bacterium]